MLKLCCHFGEMSQGAKNFGWSNFLLFFWPSHLGNASSGLEQWQSRTNTLGHGLCLSFFLSLSFSFSLSLSFFISLFLSFFLILSVSLFLSHSSISESLSVFLILTTKFGLRMDMSVGRVVEYFKVNKKYGNDISCTFFKRYINLSMGCN